MKISVKNFCLVLLIGLPSIVQALPADPSSTITETPETDISAHHQPPQAAIDACGGKVEGDPCNFIGRRDESVEGTCHKRRIDSGLVCAPERGHQNRNPASLPQTGVGPGSAPIHRPDTAPGQNSGPTWN